MKKKFMEVNSTERKKLKELLKDKRLPVILVSLIAMVSFALSFAWFTGEIKTYGTIIKTGKIVVAMDSYQVSGDGGEYTVKDAVHASTDGRNIDIKLVNEMIPVEIKEGKPTDVYFMIEKPEGALPIELALSFELSAGSQIAKIGLDNQPVVGENGEPEYEYNYDMAYAGGYYFKLEELTNVSGMEKSDLLSYLAVHGTTNNASERSLSTIGDYVARSLSLTETPGNTKNYTWFHLTCAPRYEDAKYSNRKFVIGTALSAAQEGAISGAGYTYMVSTYEQLEKALDEYTAGDTINVVGDITVDGDLLFDRPVKVYITNSTLAVNGNLIFSYAYEDNFILNTQNGGKVAVRQYNGYGGNFEINLPNASMQIVGEDRRGYGEADIYVSNNFNVLTSHAPYNRYDELGGRYGLTVTRACIRSGSDDPAYDLKTPAVIRLKNDAQISVAEHTEIGTLMSYYESNESTYRVSVINNGTINSIDLSNMQERIDYTHEYNVPQIFIDNYNQTVNPIILPSWAVVFNRAVPSGNTRIIHRIGASEPANTNMKYIAQSGADFDDFDVERERSDVYVKDVSEKRDGSELYIYYTDLGADQGRSLQSITDEWLEANNVAYADVKKINIFSIFVNNDQHALDNDDFSYIKSFTNLESLDLSKALADTTSGDAGISYNLGVIPQNAFKDLSKLNSIALPLNASYLSSNAFSGCSSLDELTLPNKLNRVSSTAFSGSAVKFIHVAYEDDVISNLPNNTYLFVPAQLLDSYISSYGTKEDKKAYIHREAVRSLDKKYFYRIVSADCAEIACYVENFDWDYVLSEEPSFFSKISVDGTPYFVSAFDPFCFYIKKLPTLQEDLRKSIAFSPYLISVGEYAFYQAKGISDIAFFSQYPCTIGNYAFYQNTELKSASFDGVIRVGNYAFFGCSALGPEVRLPDADYIGSNSFASCTNMEVLIADNVVECGGSIVSNCNALAVAKFPKLAKWGDYMFGNASVIETAVPYNIGGYGWHNGGTRAMWIVHPENAIGDKYSLGNGNPLGGMRIVSASTDNDFNKNFVGTNNDCISTGEFKADSYYYMDDTNPNNHVVPYTFTIKGETKRLSDYGYGDYLVAVDKEKGEAMLVYSTLKTIYDEYTLPDEITVDGVDYPITSTSDYVAKDGNHSDIYSLLRAASRNGVSLVIPESYKRIGNMTFSFANAANKDNFVSVEFKTDNCDIGEYAFYYTGITKALLPETSANIGSYAFYQCTKIEQLRLPDTCNIGQNAFFRVYGCTTVESVHWPQTSCVINSGAFAEGQWIYADLSHCTSIGGSAFSRCPNLENVDFNEEPYTIGASAFSDYSNKITRLDLKGCTKIEANAFSACTNVEYIDAPNLKTITSGECFSSSFTKLRYLNLESITDISSSAFNKLYQLNIEVLEINFIDSSMVSQTYAPRARINIIHTENAQGTAWQQNFYDALTIGNGKMDGKIILVTESTDNSFGYNFYKGLCDKYTSHLISTGITTPEDYIWADELREDYQAGRHTFTYQNNYANYSALDIGDYLLLPSPKESELDDQKYTLAVSLLDSITTDYTVPAALSKTVTPVTEPEETPAEPVTTTYTVDRIGMNAFASTSFTSGSKLTIPNGIINIGDYAFQKKNIGSIMFLASNTYTIGNYSFESCSVLEEVVMDKCTSVGDYAFQNCQKMITVHSDEVEVIGKRSFYNTDNLNFIYMPKLRLAKSEAFGDGHGLANSMPRKVAEIGVFDSLAGDTAGSKENWLPYAHLIIIHTENAKGAVLNPYKTLNTPGNCKIIIPSSTDNPTGINYYEQYKSVYTDLAPYIIDGYNGASDYVWADEPSLDLQSARITVNINGEDKYMSDFGYGDYFLIKYPSTGKYTLERSFLGAATHDFTVPVSVTKNETAYYVDGIGANCFKAYLRFAAKEDGNNPDFIIPDGIKRVGAGLVDGTYVKINNLKLYCSGADIKDNVFNGVTVNSLEIIGDNINTGVAFSNMKWDSSATGHILVSGNNCSVSSLGTVYVDYLEVSGNNCTLGSIGNNIYDHITISGDNCTITNGCKAKAKTLTISGSNTLLNPDKCFQGSSFETIYLTGENTQFGSTLCFESCKNLKYVDLTGVTGVIGKSTFSQCGIDEGMEVVFSDNSFSLGANVFMDSTIKDVDIKGCTSIGNSAFANCKLIKNVDFGNCTTLDGQLSGCYNVISVRGDEVTTITGNLFGNDTAKELNLKFVCFPKLSSMPNNYNTFKMAKGIEVFESAPITRLHANAPTNVKIFDQDKGPKYWIIHTENGNATESLDIGRTNIGPTTTIFVSSSTDNPASKNFYQEIYNKAGASIKDCIIDTGDYTPEDYIWANSSVSSARKRITLPDGTIKYYSDYGYGDYLLGADMVEDPGNPGQYIESGTATIVTNIVNDISGAYTVPTRMVSNSGRTYAVTGIGMRAFAGCTGITELNTGGVTRIARDAFVGAPNLTYVCVAADQPLIAEGKFISDDVDLDAFTIRVTKFQYESYYFPYHTDAGLEPNSEWMGIPEECFKIYDVNYRPNGDEGPFFLLSLYGTGTDAYYELVYVGDVADTDTVIKIPSTYPEMPVAEPVEGPESGGEEPGTSGGEEPEEDDTFYCPVKLINADCFNEWINANIEVIILPKQLVRFFTDYDGLPVSLKALRIDEGAPVFKTVDGVLYSADGVSLIYYPIAKPDAVFRIESGCTAIAAKAFCKNASLKHVILPAVSTEAGTAYQFIAEHAFSSLPLLEEADFAGAVIFSNESFVSCSALTDVNCTSTLPCQFLGENCFGENHIVVVHVPSGYYDQYQNRIFQDRFVYANMEADAEEPDSGSSPLFSANPFGSGESEAPGEILDENPALPVPIGEGGSDENSGEGEGGSGGSNGEGGSDGDSTSDEGDGKDSGSGSSSGGDSSDGDSSEEPGIMGEGAEDPQQV